MLYPIESESRQAKELSGLWRFRVDRETEGRNQNWQERPLTDTILMPVPASYNDIMTDRTIRDHIGDAWYERTFFVPAMWEGQRVVLRVGSATHHAVMWINGQEATKHKGGFLPFEADISDHVKYGEENRVTICVNNILDWSCLPPGCITKISDVYHPEELVFQNNGFDFFNYSGIHRPVRLYTTPAIYIADITVTTDIQGSDGIMRYAVESKGGNADIKVIISDERGNIAAEGSGERGTLTIPGAKLWQPGNAYLYTLTATATGSDGKPVDTYRLPVGIRTVKVEGNQFLINGKSFYFKGCAKHEDSDIRGKGLDEALNIRDINLFKWLGANSFRTSHYPYSEEMMRLCDQEGIVVIDEVPAVAIDTNNREIPTFCEERANDRTLEHHKQMMREMITRDKNHPCVVMWSIGNENATYEDTAVPYFTEVIAETRRLDPTRPIILVLNTFSQDEKVAQLLDVIGINRYWGWYADTGHTELIEKQMDKDLQGWHEKFNKPVIVTEFGADTVAGMHQLPAVTFSEEYQCEFLEQYFKSFDKFDFVIGEQVWNFADFATKQEITRVIGNKKGVFTRQRQPKAAAFTLRSRWRGTHPKW